MILSLMINTSFRWPILQYRRLHHFPELAVTKEFNFPMFFALAKSIEYKAGEGGKETFTPFAQTSQFSWGETDKQPPSLMKEKI